MSGGISSRVCCDYKSDKFCIFAHYCCFGGIGGRPVCCGKSPTSKLAPLHPVSRHRQHPASSGRTRFHYMARMVLIRYARRNQVRLLPLSTTGKKSMLSSAGRICVKSIMSSGVQETLLLALLWAVVAVAQWLKRLQVLLWDCHSLTYCSASGSLCFILLWCWFDMDAV